MQHLIYVKSDGTSNVVIALTWTQMLYFVRLFFGRTNALWQHNS
jgi:hypothetical protein